MTARFIFNKYQFNLFQILKKQKLKNNSFLDFYCPKCEQATTILFKGVPSGYWGIFEFEIYHIFVLKFQEGRETIVSKLKKIKREKDVKNTCC